MIDYHCTVCNCLGGVRLWRETTTCLPAKLFCFDCAHLDQEKEPNAESDQIGWLVPAVLTPDGDTFWSYSAVPGAGCRWWYSKPVGESLRAQAYGILRQLKLDKVISFHHDKGCEATKIVEKHLGADKVASVRATELLAELESIADSYLLSRKMSVTNPLVVGAVEGEILYLESKIE